MDADIAALRKRIHDRMFAAQEAADQELEGGNDSEHGILQDEAVWLATLLADFDEAVHPNDGVNGKLEHVKLS